MSWDEMVLVGRIGRPFGLRGQVFVQPETDFIEERFAAGGTLWTRSDRGDEQLTIASARVQNGRLVVAFDGFAAIDDVQRLAGCELRVPEAALAALEDGRYYQHQLAGCVVRTRSGEAVGVVSRVDGGAGGALLVVEGTRGEVLIPFAADICVDVDIPGRSIVIEPPDGLLELNETKTRA